MELDISNGKRINDNDSVDFYILEGEKMHVELEFKAGVVEHVVYNHSDEHTDSSADSMVAGDKVKIDCKADENGRDVHDDSITNLAIDTKCFCVETECGINVISD